ncbi:M15 family metallopeptidase [Paracoccus pacificus]|uniref:M15 family metallopeptidase n=1 Tax=Paracoccus pacificus TaxID=1463598 RepID=A0ABW4R464_9RHOB
MSAHNIGEAVDVVHGLYHWDMSLDEWRFLHALGVRVLDRLNAGVPAADRLRLEWGGNWSSLYDPAHWEIWDFRSRRRPLADVPPVRYTPAGLRARYGGVG